jgi:aminopeptidase-like protein
MLQKSAAQTIYQEETGQLMHKLVERLFPICRSITGHGVRETLRILQEEIPLKISEIPSGTKVFDWTIPKEWNFRDAYIKNSKGEKIIDARKLNLHVLNYSIPVRKKVKLDELKEHVYTLPEHPDWIPYRTSYYNEKWGFCMSYNQMQSLKEELYEVVIDTSLEDGSLTYGEFFLEGENEDEVLISTHVCHPSMGNDNLSGIVVSAYLAKYLAQQKRKYSYRLLFIPGTIGSITWLARNENNVSKIKHGLVATCLGDTGNFTYKKSRQGNAAIDLIVPHVLKSSGEKFKVIDFFPYGYDERQYCSPGFNLPVGCLMRTPHGEFPEYHTSADNLSFVKPESLLSSLSVYSEIITLIENNAKYINLNPKCEPQLGKRGVYESMKQFNGNQNLQLAVFWVLNQSDGQNTLLDIAEKSGLEFNEIKIAADILLSCGLLKEQ